MAVAFIWKIERLECRPQVGALEDVVGKIHWRVFGVSEAVQESVYGMTEVELDAQAVFTPFEELTEETVIGWVKDRLGAQVVARYETSLTEAVDARLDPPIVPRPLPWSAA